MSHIYPVANPVKKPEVAQKKQDKQKALNIKELPVLEVIDGYLDEAIASTASIDSLVLDLNNPSNVATQLAALKATKAHLLRIKTEVHRRIKNARHRD